MGNLNFLGIRHRETEYMVRNMCRLLFASGNQIGWHYQQWSVRLERFLSQISAWFIFIEAASSCKVLANRLLAEWGEGQQDRRGCLGSTQDIPHLLGWSSKQQRWGSKRKKMTFHRHKWPRYWSWLVRGAEGGESKMVLSRYQVLGGQGLNVTSSKIELGKQNNRLSVAWTTWTSNQRHTYLNILPCPQVIRARQALPLLTPSSKQLRTQKLQCPACLKEKSTPTLQHLHPRVMPWCQDQHTDGLPALLPALHPGSSTPWSWSILQASLALHRHVCSRPNDLIWTGLSLPSQNKYST